MTTKAQLDWIVRPIPYPDLKPGDMVRLPDALGGRPGTILFGNGSDSEWGVSVPYDDGGALVYVHKADVVPVDALIEATSTQRAEPPAPTPDVANTAPQGSPGADRHSTPE